MTNRYDNNGRYRDDEQMNRRQDDRAYRQQDVSARQRFAEQQSAQGQGSRGRLRHDEVVRDHGHNAQQARRSAADYDRERFSSRNRSQEQQGYYQSAPRQGQQRYDARQSQGGRRQAHLDQSGQVPRYNAPSETGRWRKQETAAPRNVRPETVNQPYGNMVERYARGNAAYQARPDAATQAAHAASSAQGFLDTPFFFLVRIVLIVVLVAVFGIRMVMSSGPSAQLNEVNASIASQQEQLDSLNNENQQMQENIDSRQSTLDAYNAIVQASS